MASTVIKHVFLETLLLTNVRLAFGLTVALTCVTNPNGGAPATNFKTPMPPDDLLYNSMMVFFFLNIRTLNRVNLQYKKGKNNIQGRKSERKKSAGNKKTSWLHHPELPDALLRFSFGYSQAAIVTRYIDVS
jgi:hypothetical protein